MLLPTLTAQRQNVSHGLAELVLESLALKISNLQRQIEDRAGGLLDERDRLIQQRLWLRNELDAAGVG